MSSVPHFESLASDHRDLDPRIADVAGLAAGQTPVGARPDRPVPGAGAPVWHAADGSASTSSGSYYDQPVVKAPPWGQRVSAYIVVGGVAGAAATLAATAQLVGGDELRPLVRSARILSTATAVAGSGLLVSDLGRPERFLHMVRVVKPTSVMNIGGYCLSATAAASACAMLLGERRGRLGRVGAGVRSHRGHHRHPAVRVHGRAPLRDRDAGVERRRRHASPVVHGIGRCDRRIRVAPGSDRPQRASDGGRVRGHRTGRRTGRRGLARTCSAAAATRPRQL